MAELSRVLLQSSTETLHSPIMLRLQTLLHCAMSTVLTLVQSTTYRRSVSVRATYTVVCIKVRTASFPRFWKNHPW